MGISSPKLGRSRGNQPSITSTSVPASVGGVNALNSLMEMPGTDCIYTYNMMPVEYGMRLRKGWREWATGADGDVRTIIGYEGRNPGDDEMWAVTENGIYNVSLFNTTAPVEDQAFTTQGEAAGWGVHCEFVADNEDKYLYYADPLNGIFAYQTGGGWAAPANWTRSDNAEPPVQVPFPVADVAFVTVHKQRIWVILEGSSDAWYLPIHSIAGELKKFTFGSKMPHGGRLSALYNWTMDGGEGIDDYLIALSRAGDVLVYKGDDPESIAGSEPLLGGPWTNVGAWFIGELPDSRRIAISQGSELYVLSVYGITSIRDLLEGTSADELLKSPSAKVNRFLRTDVQEGIDRPGWALNANPSDGFLQVVTPEPSSGEYLQYNQNISTKAWGFWRGVPMLCGGVWNGEYYLGGTDGIVYIYDATLDGTKLDGTLGESIPWSQLTSFQGLGNHAAYKRVSFIRPIGILNGTAAVNVKAVFDYNVSPNLAAPVAQTAGDGTAWDTSNWDDSLWDYGLSSGSIPIGAMGLGRSVAIAMKGNSTNRLTLVGWDMLFDVGGLL